MLYDALAPLLLEAFEAQPADLSPVGAVRATMREVFGGASAEVLAQQDERAVLIFTVSERDVVAKRVGRRPDDLAVRALVGAVVGVGIATWVNARGSQASDYLRRMDEGLAELEAGFPTLSRP